MSSSTIPPSEPRWLEWARDLQAIAQNGLLFSDNPFDRQRYEAISGIAAQIMSAGSGEPIEVVSGLFSAQVGYATPKVDVRGVVFRDSNILLVREATDGLWALPGGWVDPNESPSESVIREIFEEAGFTTRALKLLAVFDRVRHAHVPPCAFSIYKLFILCEIQSGQSRLSIETLEVAFFPEDRLPPLSLARITPAQIARCFRHLRHPGLPTDFD